MKKQLLLALLTGSSFFLSAQTTFSVRVSSSLDDHEERAPGATQTGIVGNMDSGSSDLELGWEKPAADPQFVGMRFTNVTIPANAVITNAYIQFTVDDIAKNTDPCVLDVQAEDNVNPATFSDSPFSLSTRTLMSSMVTWTVTGSTWSVVASAGPDQRTPDLKTLVQALVNKQGWASGNSMAFHIKGYGTREVESVDGDAPNAPLLVVQYSTTATGISELDRRLTATVYPNPFTAHFQVNVSLESSATVNISVYDVTGKKLEESATEHAAPGTFTYSSSASLPAGLYFVKVQAGTKQQVFKVISK